LCDGLSPQAKEAVYGAHETAQQKAGETSAATHGQAQRAGEYIKEQAGKASDSAQDTAQGAKESAGGMAQAAKEKLAVRACVIGVCDCNLLQPAMALTRH
jgi:uncharacterized protein YjbJ (UPF0337 family)